MLYVTCEEGCSKLTEDGWEDEAELTLMQEEADTSLVLHTQHASQDRYKSAIIYADDADVFILSLAMQGDLDVSIYQKFGSKNITSSTDVKKIRLGHNVCNSLIGIHAYNGCDTVSCFGGKDKLVTLKLVKRDPSNDIFRQLGRSWELDGDLFKNLEQFTCTMYKSKISQSAYIVTDLHSTLLCKEWRS